MLSFPGGLVFIIIDSYQKDFTAIVLQAVRIMFFQNLVYGALRTPVPFQLNHHRRPVGILLWEINDIRIPLPGGQLLPLQVMVPVGIVRQLDHATKAGFFVVMQGRSLLPVHLLDLGRDRFLATLQRVQEKLIAFRQPPGISL